MHVNLSPSEYAIVCRVADYYGSYPAMLAHDWIMREAAIQYAHLYPAPAQGQELEGMLGSRAGAGPTPNDPIPTPDQGA